MQLNKIQNEFLGCISAIVVENNEQFMRFKEFLGINNLFLSDGTPAAQLNINADGKRTAFYRDDLGMFVGYDHPANVGTNYSLHEFNEAFYEQRTLFGESGSPGIKMPENDLIVDPMEDDVIDADVKEVVNELTLVEALNQLEVGTITPAEATGNIIERKDIVINAISKYKGIVVTKENFKELTDTRADLNSKKKILTDNRKSIKEKALENVNKVWDAMTDIIKAIDEVVKPLDDDIKKFEEQEKEAQKKKMYDETINPMLNMLVEKNMIDEDIKMQFTFNPAWLNKSAVTKTGNLTKKTMEEMNTELERLVNLYDQKKNDIATIESTIKQLSIAHNLDEEALKADTYIELYKKGTPMPQVQERINQDIEMIKKTVEKEAEKKAQELTSQQQNMKQVQHINEDNAPVEAENKNCGPVETVVDDKTGELYAKGDSSKIMALVIQTPDKYAGKIFSYTYTFSGSFGAIKTFSNILKLLSKILKDFKYEKVGK